MSVLQNDAQGPAKVRFFDLVDVDAVIPDFSVLDVVKTVDQIGNGGFSHSGAAHEGDFLTRLGKELDMVQDDFFIAVSKIHIVKHDAALQLGEGHCAVRMGLPPSP